MTKRLVTICLLILLLGCAENDKPQAINDVEDPLTINVNADSNKFVVDLINREGKTIGEAEISESEHGVKISIDAQNLRPGLHGFHIHEKGVCDKPTFEMAGSHFNPDNRAHGFYHFNGPHAGDLPNLNVSDDGSVKSVYINNRVTLKRNEAHSLRGEKGTALLIHEKEDDYISQPAGQSGERIACGVISEPISN